MLPWSARSRPLVLTGTNPRNSRNLFHLNKNTSEQNSWIFRRAEVAQSPTIEPILSPSGLVNGSSEANSLDKSTTEHGQDSSLDGGLPDYRQVADAFGSLVPDFAVLVTALIVESALAPTKVGSSYAPSPLRMP